MLFMRGTQRFEAGSRFKYTPDHIEFSYGNLVKAIQEAVKRQTDEDGSDIASVKSNINSSNLAEHDFDGLMKEFGSITAKMIEQDAMKNVPRITEIVERHLGIGKKVSEMSRAQADILDIIVFELKQLK
jgi:hypothetical protein